MTHHMMTVGELSASNKYADEEVLSSYGYLSGYRPKPVAEQVERLVELFPNLRGADIERAGARLPTGAEGWFAIPRWQSIASTYGEAVEKVLSALRDTRNGKFQNFRECRLGPQYLRQLEKTREVFQKLAGGQENHDILVVAAQFGLRHRGRSVRRAREVMNSTEFGLGAFAIGVMLLTHPERLQYYDDLWIDCAGDEYSPVADGDFSHAPLFVFDGDRVEFDASWCDEADGRYGSASAFLSESIDP